MSELQVDFYAPSDQRERDIERLQEDEEAIDEKRELCKEYCGKFQDHLALMRKDLLTLASNEDAVIVHEELKGITDVRQPRTLPLVLVRL